MIERGARRPRAGESRGGTRLAGLRRQTRRRRGPPACPGGSAAAGVGVKGIGVGVASLIVGGALEWQGRLAEAEPWIQHAERTLRAEAEPPRGNGDPLGSRAA